MRRRKSSLSITLVLIGTAALSGCGNDRDQNTRVMRRDVYSSLEDCRSDWGRADDCETVSNTSSRSSSTGSGGGFYGPRYYWADSSGRYDNSTPRPGSRATSVATLGGTSASGHASGLHGSGSRSSSSVSRGGFGSSSSAHGGSSS